MGTPNVKLSVGLDLEKEEDRAAYEILKPLASSRRKSYILNSIIASSTKTSKLEITLKIFSVIVSFLLVFLSIHFTFIFNHLVMAYIWALLLSCSLVIFTTLAPTVATYVSGMTRRLFYVLWFIGISYSIFTAFAGQYNSFRAYVSVESANDTTSLVEEIASQEAAIVSEIQELKELQTPYKNLIDDLSSTPERKVDYPQTWKDANSKFDALQSKIDAKQERLDSLREQRLSTVTSHSETTSIETTTVYTWLSDLLGIRAELLEFLILVLPSCFIDFASSILLKFALGKPTTVRRKE